MSFTVKCINIPRNKNVIIVNNVNNQGIKQNMQLTDVIDLIEIELIDIVDLLVKDALRSYKNKYYILGGKALNSLVGAEFKSTVNRSYDYDIHVANHTDVTNISKHIAININNTTKLHWKAPIKSQIFRKLRHLNLVDNTLESTYFNTDLFYYGTRKSRDNTITINSVFIKFTFRSDLFNCKGINNYKYTNLTSINGVTVNYDVTAQYTHNEIYLPIIDIDTDTVLNKGVIVMNSGVLDVTKFNSSTYISPYDRIRYADVYVLTFNLLRLIALGYKQERNIKKFRNLFDFNKLSCDISKIFTPQKNTTHLNNITPQINLNAALTLLADAQSHNAAGTIGNKLTIGTTNYVDNTYYSILHNYRKKFDSNKKKCVAKIGANVSLTNIAYIFAADMASSDKTAHALSEISYNVDKNYDHIAFVYSTNDIYKEVNLFNVYNYNKFTIDWNNPSWHRNITPRNNNLSINNKTLKVKVNGILLNNATAYNNVCKKLDDSIVEFHKQFKTSPHMSKVADEFEVFTFQQIANFYFDSGSLIGMMDLKVNDVIFYPQYISTSYSVRSDLSIFSHHNKVILKIKLKKNDNVWMFMDRYSNASAEYEILIMRNKHYIVTDVSSIVAEIYGEPIEYKLISLSYVPSLESALALVTSPDVITTSTKDNIAIKTTQFIHAAIYAYDNHLSKPYAETNLALLCPGLEFDLDVSMKVTINGTQKEIHRYNHALVHSLRVAAYVQLFGLIYKYFSRNVESVYNMITSNLLWKASIVAIFLVTGRQSEASFTTKCSNLPPDKQKPYERYLHYSSENFKKYARTTDGKNIFSDEEVRMYSYLIKNYYNIYYNTNSITDLSQTQTYPRETTMIAYIFAHAHDLDLIRCKPNTEWSIHVPVNITVKQQIDEYTDLLLKVAVSVTKKTGDRITGSPKIIDYTNYNYKIFYKCSTDVKYCISEICGAIVPYIQDLLDNINQLDATKQPQIQAQSPASVPELTSPPTLSSKTPDAISKYTIMQIAPDDKELTINDLDNTWDEMGRVHSFFTNFVKSDNEDKIKICLTLAELNKLVARRITIVEAKDIPNDNQNTQITPSKAPSLERSPERTAEQSREITYQVPRATRDEYIIASNVEDLLEERQNKRIGVDVYLPYDYNRFVDDKVRTILHSMRDVNIIYTCAVSDHLFSGRYSNEFDCTYSYMFFIAYNEMLLHVNKDMLELNFTEDSVSVQNYDQIEKDLFERNKNDIELYRKAIHKKDKHIINEIRNFSESVNIPEFSIIPKKITTMTDTNIKEAISNIMIPPEIVVVGGKYDISRLKSSYIQNKKNYIILYNIDTF